jgi:hypothetical protein
MAQIRLYDLNPVGSELFQDAENYLNELNEEEVDRLWDVSEIALSFTFDFADGQRSDRGYPITQQE